MATVVNRPRSVLDDIPVSSQGRQTSVVEVIDVDSADEVTSVSGRPASHPQESTGMPSRDIISLLDSDDDDSHLAPGSSRTRTRRDAGSYFNLPTKALIVDLQFD